MPETNPYAITPVVTPIVHLNGDRKSTLLAQLEVAYDAVHAASKALSAAWPNARNYYPVPGRMEEALAQHRQRMQYLAAIIDSLEAECIQIQEENPERR